MASEKTMALRSEPRVPKLAEVKNPQGVVIDVRAAALGTMWVMGKTGPEVVGASRAERRRSGQTAHHGRGAANRRSMKQ